MPFLIDGHNLIPKIPNLSLSAIDDETHLIELLQDFCRLNQKDAEIFFDNAPPGQSRKLKKGRITVNFVRQGRTADTAIEDRLTQLGNSARNWTVVSSDRAVQASARQFRAYVMSSEKFSDLLENMGRKESTNSSGEGNLPVIDVEDWIKFFKENKIKK